MSAVRRLARLAGRLGIGVLSACLTLLGLEYSARWLSLRVPFFLYPSPQSCLQRSPRLSLEFRPNCTGFLAETTFHTNALGLRGDQVREDGSQRVLALGDSSTWGWKVEDGESYPSVLQQLLDQRAGPGRFQIINAGVPGYTSYQGLRYLRERGVMLDPAVVIVGFGFNDATRDGEVVALIARQERLIRLLELDDLLLDWSHMYRWARWKLEQQRERRPSLIPFRVRPNEFTIYLTNIVELARERGARVLLLDLLTPDGPLPSYRAALAEIASSTGVPLVSYDGPRIDVFHPTSEGYRMLAGKIGDHLAADGALHVSAAAP